MSAHELDAAMALRIGEAIHDVPDFPAKTYLLRCGQAALAAIGPGRSDRDAHVASQRRHARQNGTRDAITWLHAYTAGMNDPHAQAILNTAAFALGTELSQGKIAKFSPEKPPVPTAPRPPSTDWKCQITGNHPWAVNQEYCSCGVCRAYRETKATLPAGHGPHDYAGGSRCINCGVEYDRVTTPTWCNKHPDPITPAAERAKPTASDLREIDEASAREIWLCCHTGYADPIKVIAQCLSDVRDGARREAEADMQERAAKAAEGAQLPSHFRWGRDAMEQFNFGKKRSAFYIRALPLTEEETIPKAGR